MSKHEISIGEMSIGSGDCRAFAHRIAINKTGVDYEVSVGGITCERRDEAQCALQGLASVSLCFSMHPGIHDRRTLSTLAANATDEIRSDIECPEAE